MMSKARLLVGLGLITLICSLSYAIFLRVHPLTTQPYWMDEGYTINAVISYAKGQQDGVSAILDSGARYECFLYCYPTALLTDTFGASPTTYRALSVIFGVLSIFIILAVGRQLYSLPVGLLAGFFTAFSYIHIAWSTQARWYTLFLFLFWCSVLLLVRASIAKNHRTQLVLIASATFAAVLATATQKLGVLLFGIIPAYLLWHYRKTLRTSLTTERPWQYATLTAIALCLLALATPWGQQVVGGFLKNLTPSYVLPYYLSFYLREYIVLIVPTTIATMAALPHSRFLVALFFAYLLPLSFLSPIVHYRYLFHLTPVFFIVAAAGAFFLDKALSERYPRARGTIVAITVLLFFITGIGTLTPADRYFLESDDPETLSPRPSYAYTPQPNWNAAYAYIRENQSDGDIIISTQPPMTKIFTDTPGYWLSYDYLGLDNRNTYRTTGDKEYYVGATSIDSTDELATLLSTAPGGFIVFDYMATDGRLPDSTLNLINTRAKLVFEERTNSYSHVWVYQF